MSDVYLAINPKTGAVGARSHIYKDCLYLGYEYITVPKEVAWEKYDVGRTCARCSQRFAENEIARFAIAKEGGKK